MIRTYECNECDKKCRLTLPEECGIPYRKEKSWPYLKVESTTKGRSINTLFNMTLPHVRDRLEDPKNVCKGPFITNPPEHLKNHREVQRECLELVQARIKKEGIDREIEECADVIAMAMIDMLNMLSEE